MTEQNQYSHIKIEVGVSPVKYNVAFTSINSRGGLGQLNLYVLKELGYDNAEIEKIDVSNGYYLLNNGRNKPILFIVTVGNNEFSGITLQRNLRLALEKHQSFLKSKNVWVPLMATGAGGLNFIDSFDTIRGQLKNYPNTNFTIAVPDDERGMEFMRINSGQGQQNDIDIDFIIELLNLEYTIALEKEVPISSGNKKYFFDLADLNNLTFVEFKEQKSATDRANLRKEINSSISRLSQISPKKKSQLIVVINGLLTNNDRKFYDTNLRLLKNEKVVLYDNVDIENLSNKHNLDNNSSKTISDSDVIFNEKYKTHRFVRDVLNQEYSLNLVIEETRILYGSNLDLDLTDDEAKSYVKILNKDNVVSAYQARGITYNEILSKISFDITSDLGLLNSSDSVNNYFAFLDDSFDNDDIEFVKKELAGYDSDLLQILTMSDITLLAEKNNIKLINYFDFKNSSNSPVGESTKIDSGNDKIPFQLDQVVSEDKLGREPVAAEFVRLIKTDVFKKDFDHSFMVHLQGEWGEGKSSFLNFIKKHLYKGDNYWMIIDYNAWQNQDIDPPWWSFLDQLYKQAMYNLPVRTNHYLFFREKFRRLIKYKPFSQFINLLLVIAFIIILLKAFPYIINIDDTLSNINDAEGEANRTESITLFLLQIVTALGALIAIFYSLAKFVSKPFFVSSQDSAKTFLQYASDPKQKLKKHFESIIEDINASGFQVAIFIDDLDRCDKEFIVKLLEGIQTLFKDKKVLYIVASDKKWITTSFGKTYQDFSPEGEDFNRLGEFFLEKAFQMSFRVPKISDEAKKEFWDYLIKKEKQVESDIRTIDDLTTAEQEELIDDLSNSEEDITDPNVMKEKQEQQNISPEILTSAVLRLKNRSSEDEKHLLESFHEFLDKNPRSIIRLANNFTMTRNILIAERRMFDKRKIFRWLAIESLFPKIGNVINKLQDQKDIKELLNEIKDLEKRAKCQELYLDSNNTNGGPITLDEIKIIKGL